MKKTFKEKLLNNSFTAYMRALNASPLGSERNRGKMIELVLVIFSSIFTFVFLNEIASGREDLEYILPASGTLFFYVVWLMLGVYRRAKPSPLGLLPISWKKRVGYSYLSNLVYVVVATVAMIAFAFVIMLLICVLVFLSTGYWGFVIEDSDWVTEYAPPMHQVFEAFSALFVYGAGASISSLKSKKWRIGMYVAFPVGIKIFSALVLNIHYRTPYVEFYGDVTDILMSGNLSAMWLSFVIVLAVAVCALSVFLHIRAEKPNKV